MAAGSNARVLRVPGRICANPTTTSGSFPYGGTALGKTRGLTVQNLAGFFPITAWELGGAPVEYLHRGEAWMAHGFLWSWDNDAVALVWPNSAVGAITQHRRIVGPGTVKPGHRLSALSAKILFVPDDLTRAPAWILRKAVPMPKEGSSFVFDRDEDFGLEVAFMGIPDAQGDTFECGRFEDISL